MKFVASLIPSGFQFWREMPVVLKSCATRREIFSDEREFCVNVTWLKWSSQILSCASSLPLQKLSWHDASFTLDYFSLFDDDRGHGGCVVWSSPKCSKDSQCWIHHRWRKTKRYPEQVFWLHLGTSDIEPGNVRIRTRISVPPVLFGKIYRDQEIWGEW